MSSAGHVLDAIKRFNQNQAYRTARKMQYAKVKEVYGKIKTKHIEINGDKKMSPHEFAAFKQKIKHQIARENKRIILGLCLGVVLGLSIILYIYLRYFK